MISFIVGVVLLVLGYFIYGKIIDKIFAIRPEKPTPAYTMQDGMDYVPMKTWKCFLIQLLNIAGVGPICGAIMGARFGTASFIWIVFGCIFAGAMHDYFSGMMSIRNKGCSLPELHGRYQGPVIKQIMRIITLFLIIVTVVSFVTAPAQLLKEFVTPDWNIYIWICIIFAYYIAATMLPINTIIGKIYPVFGVLLIFMALCILAAFVIKQPAIPEVWDGSLINKDYTSQGNPLFPLLFVSISCGAISGFHGTQSPLMARCMTNEKHGRKIFYGAMIVEGIITLIWAAAAAYFYGPESPIDTVGKNGPTMAGSIANLWFPSAIAFTIILGIIGAAVTTGDTALRSGRLIAADIFRIHQKSLRNRLLIVIPLVSICTTILVINLAQENAFEIVWRHLGWLNQILAVVTLWAISDYLALRHKHTHKLIFLISLIPALFITMVCATYPLVFCNLTTTHPVLAYSIAGGITLIILLIFGIIMRTHRQKAAIAMRKSKKSLQTK